MPLYREISHDHARIFIWKIEEEENFFTSQIQISSDIHHPKRRIEYLAGRYLLQMMTPDIDLSLIKTNDAGKPYCEDYDFHFSISHSYPFVAVGVIYLRNIGVDVQVYSDKVIKIKDKFLTIEEQALCRDDNRKYNLLWNAKEAIYKWLGTGGQTFKEEFIIKKLRGEHDVYEIEALITTGQGDILPKNLRGKLLKEFSIAYIVDDEVS